MLQTPGYSRVRLIQTSEQTVALFSSTGLAQPGRQDSVSETSVRAALLRPGLPRQDLDYLCTPWTASPRPGHPLQDLDFLAKTWTSLPRPGQPCYALDYLATTWTSLLRPGLPCQDYTALCALDFLAKTWTALLHPGLPRYALDCLAKTWTAPTRRQPDPKVLVTETIYIQSTSTYFCCMGAIDSPLYGVTTILAGIITFGIMLRRIPVARYHQSNNKYLYITG